MNHAGGSCRDDSFQAAARLPQAPQVASIVKIGLDGRGGQSDPGHSTDDALGF